MNSATKFRFEDLWAARPGKETLGPFGGRGCKTHARATAKREVSFLFLSLSCVLPLNVSILVLIIIIFICFAIISDQPLPSHIPCPKFGAA